MIYFDATKTGASRHQSGLVRVSTRLREELGAAASAVCWNDGWKDLGRGVGVAIGPSDWLLTPELFSEAERPGFRKFVQDRSCRLAAIYHDAIPLKFPQITWPQSVSRHPEYMKLLAGFDRVFAVSEASRGELLQFWKWQGANVRAAVETISLGADFQQSVGKVGVADKTPGEPPLLLCIGILEPRKNQQFLGEVAESLAEEGTPFRLQFVGRVNPHFGVPMENRLREVERKWPGIRYGSAMDDAALLALWRKARASVFPTIAEGCGLPLLESLGMGVPCVCSDLPVLRENGEGGGCEFVPVNDVEAWAGVLRRVLNDDDYAASLTHQARARVVPTWRQTAAQITRGLS